MERRRRFDDRSGEEAGLHLSDPIDQIPADRRERARSALAATFGRSPVTSLEPITLGASASSYRIEIGGRPYLLRLEGSRRNEVRDPHRSYVCMRAAAETGIAPAVHHADPIAAVAITDFVAHRPMSDFLRVPSDLVRDLGRLVARLQAIPAFPPVIDYPTMVGRLFDGLLGAGMFASGLLDPHQEGFERIREAYSWDSGALVSSHNDLTSVNILFDGERLWFIDWETAYRNDPLVDVATLTIFIATSPELEEVLLRSWLGREPDRTERARLVLMRSLARLYYGCAASLNAAHVLGTVAPESDFEAPTRAEFVAAVEQGRLALGGPEAQRLVGKMFLASFLAGATGPEFEEALGMVRQG
jgi:aminoglycoside phosphotransferase (APT) family kinase protein